MNASPERERPPAVETLKADETSHENKLAGVSVPPGGFDRKEASALFRTHVKTIDRWIRAGKLIVKRTPGGRPRIHGVRA